MIKSAAGIVRFINKKGGGGGSLFICLHAMHAGI